MSLKIPNVVTVALGQQAGDSMKARLPKSYLNLPQREKDAINNLVQSEYEKMLNEEEVELFTQYTKMMCIVLHDYFGFGESRLRCVMGNFKTLRRRYSDVKTAQEISPLLDKEMERIFRKSKFPQEFVERLQRDV